MCEGRGESNQHDTKRKQSGSMVLLVIGAPGSCWERLEVRLACRQGPLRSPFIHHSMNLKFTLKTTGPQRRRGLLGKIDLFKYSANVCHAWQRAVELHQVCPTTCLCIHR